MWMQPIAVVTNVYKNSLSDFADIPKQEKVAQEELKEINICQKIFKANLDTKNFCQESEPGEAMAVPV